MSTRQLPDFVAPRGQASEELHALVGSRLELDERLDVLDLQQREARASLDQASAALADLERAAAAGQQVAKTERTKAERELTEAKIAYGQPWAERRAGVHAAIRDAEQGVTAFVVEHLGELIAELHEDAEAAAEDLNRACRALEAAYARRMSVEEQVTRLASTVRPARPGDVRRTRAEAVVRDAERLLAEGGETPPTLAVDPRQPRHQPVAAEQPAA